MQRFLPGLVLLAAAGAAGAAAIHDSDAEFARPHQLVDIGGRRLNLYCSGNGPVTVVFDSIATDAGWNWHAVQPAVAARTRACVYDRAGVGFSDPSPAPVTSGSIVADLHALLARAGIAPPYVMVGSSFGAMNVQLYAYRHPDEVKGMVLVDAPHEDETERMNKASQGKLKSFDAMIEAFTQGCASAAEQGFDRGSALFTQCTGGLGDVYGRELAAARLASVSTSRHWKAVMAESAGFEASSAELKAARRSYGALPMILLVRGVSPYAVPGKPQSALNKATEAEHLAMQKEIAAFSTRSTLRIVPGAGHVIHETRPEAVVQAVLEVVEQVRQ